VYCILKTPESESRTNKCVILIVNLGEVLQKTFPDLNGKAVIADS
jgi:hypothetical protein